VGGLADVVDGLRAEWGLDFRAAWRVLDELAAGGTVGELVRRTRVGRHEVEDVLRRVEPWLRRDGDRYTLTEAVEPLSEYDEDLTGTMAEIAADSPAPSYELDHVSATPETMADRVYYLTSRYALAGATVLCVGDHDLTSIAIGLAEPAAEVLVVDIDERILEFIDRTAAERGLNITTAFADLRLGLPPSFAGRADLVFTDPPYTPDGVGLFLTRGMQGLRRSGHERVAFAYGFADRQLARGFRTQAVVHELRLVVEALLPGFNRFDGAEAIGAASDLYVCRPTRFSWPVLERGTAVDPRIYTRGVAAAESSSAELPESIVDAARSIVDTQRPVYVGDGWPAEREGKRVTLADFLASPPQRRRPLLVNLYPHFEASLPQALLTASASRAVLVVPRGAALSLVDSPMWTLLTRAGVGIETDDRDETSLITIIPATGTAEPYATLVSHPEAKVGNAWRDALIAANQSQPPLTKNQARTLIRDTGVPSRALGLRLGELPRHLLAALVDALAAGN
jgi:hypothetical protein